MDGPSDYRKVRNSVYKTLRGVVGVKKSRIDEDTPWYLLNAESFELVEFIIALREEFHTGLSAADLVKMKNLKDIIDYFYEKRPKR
jgi:acyl carrier protein